MNPCIVSFNTEEQTFSKKKITIFYRDFEGIDESIDVATMPTTLTNEHHYNLVNQGWQENEINKVFKDQKSTQLIICNGS